MLPYNKQKLTNQTAETGVDDPDEFRKTEVFDLDGTLLEQRKSKIRWLNVFYIHKQMKLSSEKFNLGLHYLSVCILFSFHEKEISTLIACSKLSTFLLTWFPIIPASILGSIISIADMASNKPNLQQK